jgi:hypothetical protein
MTISTYSELQGHIADFLNRQDLTAAIPTFIRLAEARLGRKLATPERETVANLSTVDGTQTVSLPTDYEYTRQLKLSGEYPLKMVSLEKLEDYGITEEQIKTLFVKHWPDN